MKYVGENPIIGMALGSQMGKKLYLGNALLWESGFPVSYTLDGATTNGSAFAAEGDTYTATLNGTSGKQIIHSTVVVTMDGTDITSIAYNPVTRTITIADVTGSISIKAEAATIPSEYETVHHIGVDTANANSVITLEYKPNSNTKIELDVELKDVQGLLYGTLNGTSASASSPNFFAYIRITSSGGSLAFGASASGTSTVLALRTGKRFNFVCDKGVYTFVRRNQTSPYNYTLTQGSWSSGTKVRLFGRYNGTTAYGAGKIFRVKISESAVLHDYVPVKRLSDNRLGLYDTIENVATPFILASTSYTTE